MLEQRGGVMPFVRRSGLHKTRVYSALKGSRSLAVVAEVVRLHPDVDARWLLTGRRESGRVREVGPEYGVESGIQHDAVRRLTALLDRHGDLVAMRVLGYLDAVEPELRDRDAD